MANLIEINEILNENKLNFEITDSTFYNPDFPKYTVLSHFPTANSKVKKNRKIYLTVNPTNFRKVEIPNIIQITKRSAISSLLSTDLEIGEILYENNIEKDMVIQILFNDDQVEPGLLVPKKNHELTLFLAMVSHQMMNKVSNIDDLNSELFEHFQFKADKGQEPLRVDKFLMNRIENATRNKIQKAAKKGYILINDFSVKPSQKVKPQDSVRVMFSHPPYENLLEPENISLDVVFEDQDLIIVNKPPGIVVHPGHGNYNGTLLNGLIYHFQNLPNNEQGRPGLVHRIDKDTSGLLVVAKTESAMTDLAKQFFLKSTKRVYNALVWGF